jgi:predicted nucleic acid-binding Zn ribbon protein
MAPHTAEIATPEEESERAPLAKPSGPVVVSSRPCPVCGAPLIGRQTACSGKCRAARSRRRRAGALGARDARLRTLAAAILRELGDEDRA